MAYSGFTPRRAEALRKAQLASAAKRRKYGVKYQAKKSFGQSIQRAKLNKKKTVKYAAIGLAGTATAYGAYRGLQTPSAKYAKGMTKSTIKAYRGGKRGPALKTHQNRVRPLIKRNAKKSGRPIRMRTSIKVVHHPGWIAPTKKKTSRQKFSDGSKLYTGTIGRRDVYVVRRGKR